MVSEVAAFFAYLALQEVIVFLSTLLHRDKQPEIMDQPGLAAADHANALRALARINWISNVAGTLWNPIRQLAENRRGQPLRVLDLASGGGDVPIRLACRARRARLPITFSGAELSQTARDFAFAQARMAGVDVDFLPCDALHGSLPGGFDIITCSLYLHHLEADQAIDLLKRMGDAAGSMVLVSDLIRSRMGFLLAYVGTRILSRSAVAHYDGPQSVRAAFTMAEATQMAQRAGLTRATLSWRWPYRFLLQWSRPQ